MVRLQEINLMTRTGVDPCLHSTMVRLQEHNEDLFVNQIVVYIPLWLDYKSSTRKAHGSKEFGAISVDHSFYILLYKILLVKNKQF